MKMFSTLEHLTLTITLYRFYVVLGIDLKDQNRVLRRFTTFSITTLIIMTLTVNNDKNATLRIIVIDTAKLSVVYAEFHLC
jgi:hypothetical protein